jgi:hypothetical protein
VERFWSETFMGAAPRPVAGYTTGGTTDLPFTILAAANDKKAVIGLTPPEAEQNGDVKNLLRDESAAVAWIFVDLPKLGVSLAEMPSVNALLYEDEDRPIDTKSADSMRQLLGSLGSVFVTFDSAVSGRARWF